MNFYLLVAASLFLQPVLVGQTSAEARSNACGRGPRRVPTPRGSALVRAKNLGLGTRQAAGHLISKAPKPRWVRVAANRGHPVKRLLWPVRKTKLGRGFGFTRDNLPDRQHKGVDIKAKRGVTVRAAADGLVAYSDNGVCGYGNMVMIVHPNGWVTLYAHLQKATVQAGAFVKRGERIGLVGDTGKARGPHLHFELYEKGRPTDPVAHFVGVKLKQHQLAKATKVTKTRRLRRH